MQKFLLAALLGCAAHPLSAQGLPDASFGGGDGWAMMTSSAAGDDLVTLSGGKTLACGSRTANGFDTAYLTRRLVDGSLDTTYAGAGLYLLNDESAPAEEHRYQCALSRDGNDRVHLALLGPGYLRVIPLDGQGVPIAVAPPAWAKMPIDVHRGFIDLVVRAGITHVAVGTRVGTQQGRVYKLDAQGFPYAGWGTSGMLSIDDGSSIGDLRRIAVTPSGGLLTLSREIVSGGASDHVVLSYAANGVRNLAFAGTGSLHRSLGVYDYPRDLFGHADGRFTIMGTVCSVVADVVPASGCQLGVARYLANGQADLSFGSNGARRFNLGFDAFLYAAGSDPQGRIVAVGASIEAQPRAVITRVRQDGSALDPGFGNAGSTLSSLDSPDSIFLAVVADAAKATAVGRGHYVRGLAAPDNPPAPYAVIARYTQ